MANKQKRNYNLQPRSTFFVRDGNILNQMSQPRSSPSNFSFDETLSLNALSLLSSLFIISSTSSSDTSEDKNICGIEIWTPKEDNEHLRPESPPDSL